MSLLTQFYPGPGGGDSTTVVGNPGEISGAFPTLASDAPFQLVGGGTWPSGVLTSVLPTGIAGKQGAVPAVVAFYAGSLATTSNLWTQPSDLYWINAVSSGTSGNLRFFGFKSVNNVQVFATLSSQQWRLEGDAALKALTGSVTILRSGGFAQLFLLGTGLTDVTGLNVHLIASDATQLFFLTSSNTALGQASVDHLAASCLAVGTVAAGSTINTSGGTSAAISAADAAALVANGWTVTSN
jgi:hypothetical protein